MATKQTYTAAAPWSASQLADLLRQAFIEAGLMGDWFDAFVSGGIENRILRIVNDSTRTYGTVFYWFMVTATGVFIHTALGWNATTHVPSGTQYLDFYSTATNSTANHRQLNSTNLSTGINVSISRYTSTVDTNVSWFLLRNGTNYRAFMVPSAGFNALPFVDQNKVAFNGAIVAAFSGGGGYTGLDFYHGAGHTRRTYLGGAGLRGITNTSPEPYSRIIYVGRLLAPGNISNDSSNLNSTLSWSGLWLPVAHVNTQTGLTQTHSPVFTNPPASPYMAAMPSDFGVVCYWESNAMAIQDRLIVTAGLEEWEMITIAGSSFSDAGRVLFMARVV